MKKNVLTVHEVTGRYITVERAMNPDISDVNVRSYKSPRRLGSTADVQLGSFQTDKKVEQQLDFLYRQGVLNLSLSAGVVSKNKAW